MAFLKINRLWKPAADLILRAKSSIKTITRNQSILTSTSKFLRDRNNVTRQRRIVGHFTSFCDSGPTYYRYYSTDDREKRRIELNRFFTCLENNEPYNNISVLLRAPYKCSYDSEDERRFLTVFERWWSRMRSVENNKPTSTIFHLGALNKNYDGIIIEKLSKIDQLKSLEALVDEAAAVDFCSLPDRSDVLSFLNGIRDLALDAKFKKVLYPSLIPSRIELFKNIDTYLREKELVRKRQHDQNPSVDSDWMFMITEEAPAIFTCLAFNFQISYSDMNDSERDILKRACGLIKKGYDYSVETSAIRDNIKGFRMDYSTFAHAWLLWRKVNPDDLVRGIWRSWFSVYPLYSQRIGSDDESSNVHKFTLCQTLIGVCAHFRKIDSFLPVFDICLDDVRKLSPLVSRLELNQGELGDVAESFTEFVYSAGVCCNYFASINRGDLIDRMESVFLLVAMDALDAFKGKRVTSTALSRYLTGIRDFRSSASTGSNEVLYPMQFNDKLLKYLNEWMDHDLSNSCPKETLLDNAARLVLLLCRSKLNLDADVWRKLLSPLRTENSRSAFDEDEQKLGIIVSNFGEAMYYYSSSCRLQVPNDVTTGYFELAKRFLTTVNPSQSGVQTDTSEYIYSLSVVLNVACQFNAIKEFEVLKQDWQKRAGTLIGRIRSKRAAFILRDMKQMRSVQFDSKLEEKLSRRCEAYERK